MGNSLMCVLSVDVDDTNNNNAAASCCVVMGER